MQGTVWAGLMCMVTMDKPCKLMLQHEAQTAKTVRDTAKRHKIDYIEQV